MGRFKLNSIINIGRKGLIFLKLVVKKQEKYDVVGIFINTGKYSYFPKIKFIVVEIEEKILILQKHFALQNISIQVNFVE